MTAGRPWDVFGMQGQQRTWYAGSSVSFESVRSVMEYNKLLLKQMVPRNGENSMDQPQENTVKPRFDEL